MIFKEKEYRLLVQALNEANESFVTSKIASFISYAKETSTVKTIEEAISTDDYTQLPAANSGYQKIINYNKASHTLHLNQWLYKLDKKTFKFVQDVFFEHGIDLCSDMQENAFKKETKEIDSKEQVIKFTSNEYMDNSYQYLYYQLNNKTNYKSSLLAEKVFNDTTDILVHRTRKEDHVMALGLIKKAIEEKEDKDKIVNWFKTFLQINKTISPSSKKHMDYIKEKIKDWDLSKFFKNNEINLLYSSSDGFLAKKVEGLFYEVDINLIKSKTKSTSEKIGQNLRVLVKVLDEVLGNTNNYIKTTSKFNDPEIQFNILFKSEVENNQIEIMNEIVKNIVYNKEKIEKEDMSKMISAALLSVFLEKKLPEKSQTIKIKI